MKATKTKPKPAADKQNLDPLQINDRLYRQVGMLLDELEQRADDTAPRITLKERIAALIAIGRVQTIFMGLRKEHANVTDAGSSVRKYAAAFKAKDGAGGGKALPGPVASEPEPTDWFDDDDTDPDAA